MAIIPFPERKLSASEGSQRDGAPDSRNATDTMLALRISNGDEGALGELLDCYWTPLTSYASRILDDIAAGEDIVQDVFVRIWERREDWQPRSVSGFLFRMTRNQALDLIRSREARGKRESRRAREVPRRPPTPDETLDNKAFSEAINRSIQALPERQREAFILAYLEDLSYSEVAEIMDISVKTVGNHMSAALSNLREALRMIRTRKDGGAR